MCNILYYQHSSGEPAILRSYCRSRRRKDRRPEGRMEGAGKMMTMMWQ
jgi:hypothetical protein